MRAIKFRVWDKSINKWMFGYKTLGGFNFFGETVLLGELSMISLDKLCNDDYAVDQYTGLKDRNEVEIYEGDIMDYGHGRHRKIVFENGSFHMEGLQILGTLASKYEVIGNIHENQDLINN